MAAFKSDQRTNITANPKVQIKVNEFGKEYEAFWSFTTPAGNVAIADTIDLVTLPAKSRILASYIITEAMAASSTVDMGTAAAGTRYGATLVVTTAGRVDFAHTIALNWGEELSAETLILATVRGAAWGASKKFNGVVRFLWN